ncbi:uncharacterized protein [Anabrus simplex]|uniref:uncharacterized protein n=1 Tax=Anabrus simplex TaxID=316456 RepID=UPI0035A3299F
MESTWENTTSMFSSADSMLSPSEFVWERDSNLELENFQDLSKYCQRSSVDPDTLKLATLGSGNMSVSQDDELNTPMIEIQEPFFGDSTRLIPVPLDDSDGWPVTVNTRPGTFDLSIAEVAQEQQLQSDVISPESTSMNLYSPIDQEKRTIDDVVNQQVKYEEDLNIVVEREETVEMFPIEEVAGLYSDVVKLEPSNTGLHLSLPSEPVKISEFASTPDVIKQLENPQAYFDLINFIVKDTGNTEAVEPTIDFSAVQFFPKISSAQQDVLDENKTEGLNVGLSPRESSNEQEPSPFVEQPEQEITEFKQSASYSVLSRVEDNSGAPLRMTIKREPERTRRSSRNKQTTSYADLVKEDTSDDDESPSPVKRKRDSTPSCSSEGDAPCARYRELRDRNNEASRRSRQTRKAREQEMQVQAETLEKENRELKVKCDELERQLATFRQLLVDILSSKKSSNSESKQGILKK